MRWLVATGLSIAALWAIYLMSPFWAMRSLAHAIETGDKATIAERVNSRALRISIARQVIGEALARKAAADVVGGSEAQLAASAAAVAAEPLLTEIVTPEGVTRLVRALRPTDTASGGVSIDRPTLGIGSVGRLPALVRASKWRGFRTVYFTLPPGGSPDAEVRLQLRLSRLSWRLVGIDLPPQARDRLLAEWLKRRKPERPQP